MWMRSFVHMDPVCCVFDATVFTLTQPTFAVTSSPRICIGNSDRSRETVSKIIVYSHNYGLFSATKLNKHRNSYSQPPNLARTCTAIINTSIPMYILFICLKTDTQVAHNQNWNEMSCVVNVGVLARLLALNGTARNRIVSIFWILPMVPHTHHTHMINTEEKKYVEVVEKAWKSRKKMKK